jgi:L-ascorbate metabolism protein UlaG (beta-lactamase superfamily)
MQTLENFETDTFDTGTGSLSITFIGHGTLMFDWNGTAVHIDPEGRYADYSRLPKADLVLITHEHEDHLDPAAIEKILKPGTRIFLNPSSAAKLGKGEILRNGDTAEMKGIKIITVPAYNTTEGRDRFHPKGRGNGYILTIGNLRVYVAGDTEDTPEMRALSGIDIAFLPMNQPYTMTPAQAASAAKAFRPKILYPYHFGSTPARELAALLQGEPGIEVRLRKLE